MLRDVCDAAGLRSRTPPSAAVPSTNKTTSTYMGMNVACACRSRQPPQRKNVVWGVFAFFSEACTEQHEPGCPAAYIRGADRSQKFVLRYTGFQTLLESVVQISFAMRSGAGAWSLSPNFTYYATVDERSAPAFQMVNMLQRSAWSTLSGNNRATIEELSLWARFVDVVLIDVLNLFRTGKASPLAVDSTNQSLLHHVASMVSFIFINKEAGYRRRCSNPPIIALRYAPSVRPFALETEASPSPCLRSSDA